MKPGPIQVMTACETGNHKLEARHDFAKVGSEVMRTYICDVCVVCGHTVPRPLTVRDQLELGICTIEDVQRFLAQGGKL